MSGITSLFQYYFCLLYTSFLESEDPGKDIQLYINSPGGVVSCGLAIYDTMQYIKCDVSTICIGMAAVSYTHLDVYKRQGSWYPDPEQFV